MTQRVAFRGFRDQADIEDSGGGASRTFVAVLDDFLYSVDGNSPGALRWKVTADNTIQNTDFSGNPDASSQPPHLGVAGIETGAVDNAAAIISGTDPDSSGTSTWGFMQPLGAYAGWTSTFIFKVLQTAHQVLLLGFMRRLGDDPADLANFIGLRFDSENGDQNFVFQCVASEVITEVDSGVPGDTDWHVLTLRSSTAGQIVMSLDDGPETTISTNVPAIDLTPALQLVTREAVNKQALIDFWSFSCPVTR